MQTLLTDASNIPTAGRSQLISSEPKETLKKFKMIIQRCYMLHVTCSKIQRSYMFLLRFKEVCFSRPDNKCEQVAEQISFDTHIPTDIIYNKYPN